MVLCLMKKEGNLEHVRKLAVQPVDQLAVQDLMKRELYLDLTCHWPCKQTS